VVKWLQVVAKGLPVAASDGQMVKSIIIIYLFSKQNKQIKVKNKTLII